jgi:5-methylcytosine-specific restriction enzyme A
MKRRKNTGPTRAVLELVLARADLRCERCAWLLHAGGQTHHRVPRQMGGSRAEWINRPPNLVRLCAPCHQWVESYRASAMEAGWLVLRRVDPATVPIQSVLHGVVLLTDDGTTISASEEATA